VDDMRRLNVCERFDPSLNQWTIMAGMNKARSDASAIVHEGHIWIVGGFNGDQYLSSVERYNIEENTWTVMPSMRKRRGGVGCAILNGRLYAIGGHDGHQRLSSVECLDLSQPFDHWMVAPNMLSRRSNFGVCFTSEGIQVVGGFEHPSTTSKCEWFDGVQWKQSNAFPRNASALSLCPLENTSSLYNSLSDDLLLEYIPRKRQERIDYLSWRQMELAIQEPNDEELASVQGITFDNYICEDMN